jgi:hypothetical protein
METIKDELALLNPERRREILAYLVSIEDQANDSYASVMAGKIDDNRSESWMSLNELDGRLGLKDENPGR